VNIPADLKFSNSDEWIKVEGSVATIGVSDYAQEQLSDIVFVEITVAVGDSVAKNANIATIESVKAAADVNLPIAGKVVAINEDLAQTPEVVNSDPYGKAWMIKVELKSPADLNNLMDAAAYQKFCEERSH
jgi:glycine cleavage system H protein